MKRKLFILLPLLITPMLTSCGPSEPTFLTYGTYKDETARQLTSSEFSTRFEAGENMLLAIYPRESTCVCWRTFSPIIDEVTKENNLLIYKFCAEDVDDNASMKRAGGFNNRTDAPTFYIIKKGKIANYYNFSSSSDFFKKKDAFLAEINNHIILPKLYYVNEEQVDEKIKEDHSVIYFARYNCSDCNTVTPEAILPYFEKRETESRPLYVFDVEEYKEEGQEVYQGIKDKYLLSTKNNPTLGFGNGVVPTFQLYEKGEMKEMCIFYNEGSLSFDESKNCYFASDAYYNEERLPYMHYLDNIRNKDLTKIEIFEADTYVAKEKRYWDNTASFTYYNEILTSFFDAYL